MIFSEALALLLKGEYVAREVWNESSEFVALLPKMRNIWKIIPSKNPTQPCNAGNWLIDIADFLATDWKVLERFHDAVAPVVDDLANKSDTISTE